MSTKSDVRYVVSTGDYHDCIRTVNEQGLKNGSFTIVSPYGIPRINQINALINNFEFLHNPVVLIGTFTDAEKQHLSDFLNIVQYD